MVSSRHVAGSSQQAPGRVCAPACNRRALLLGVAGTLAFTSGPALAEVAEDVSENIMIPLAEDKASITQFSDIIERLEKEAAEAYANRDFKRAVDKLSELIYQQPTSPRYSEMRAQVLVDGKNFGAAVMDYNEAMRMTAGENKVDQARLTAGRALALEGEGDWKNALKDYKKAQEMALEAGEASDPYIVNSIGNCQASLGQYEDARNSYLDSANLFQQRTGFRGAGGSTTARLDGAIYANTNAALMLAQLGDRQGAMKELQNASRRGPGSVDARAALAALYFEAGNVEKAEDAWEFACDKINVGCAKYRDREWLSKVRRWPPVMVDLFAKFLSLEPSRASGPQLEAAEGVPSGDEAPSKQA